MLGDGRWINRDPIAEQCFRKRLVRHKSQQARFDIWRQSLQPVYNFTHNSGINALDYLGLREFYVLGDPVGAAPDPNDSWLTIALRPQANDIGIEHVDVYYGNQQILQGFAQRTKGLIGSANLKQHHAQQLSRVTSPDSRLRWGAFKGRPCCQVTDAQRIDTIQSSPVPASWYIYGLNDCQTDVETVIEGSCLTGYEALGSEILDLMTDLM